MGKLWNFLCKNEVWKLGKVQKCQTNNKPFEQTDLESGDQPIQSMHTTQHFDRSQKLYNLDSIIVEA